MLFPALLLVPTPPPHPYKKLNSLISPMNFPFVNSTIIVYAFGTGRGWDFTDPSRSALGAIQRPIKCVRGSGVKRPERSLGHPALLTSRLSKHAAILVRPLSFRWTCDRTTFIGSSVSVLSAQTLNFVITGPSRVILCNPNSRIQRSSLSQSYSAHQLTFNLLKTKRRLL